jgi:hypothetical protein
MERYGVLMPKRPDWFKLVEDDEPEPYVSGMVPEYVLIVLALGIVASLFLFPKNNTTTNPTPTAEVIVDQPTIQPSQTPNKITINPVKPGIPNPMLSPSNQDEEEDDEDGEDD